MYKRSLNYRILFTLIFVLLTAMVLFNVVMLQTTQRIMVQREIEGAERTADLVSRLTLQPAQGAGTTTRRSLYDEACHLFDNGRYLAARWVDAGRRERCVFQPQNPLQKTLEIETLRVLDGGGQQVRFGGKTWGIFWPQPRYVLIALPLNEDGGGGSLGLAVSMENIYQTLRGAQQINLMYMAANLVVLVLFGAYRLNRAAVKPIQRLIKQADSYRDENSAGLFHEKENSEFGQLSKSVARMIQRIESDRVKIERSLRTLEHTHAELLRSQQDVIRAEKLASVGRLAAGMAHEIGNPIGIVLGYLDLLADEDLPSGERRDYLKRTEEEVRRIDQILRQLLDFSRSPETEKEPISVHRVLDEVEELLAVHPIMQPIRTQWEARAERAVVLAVPDQLRQVFINILFNAADAIAAQRPSGGGAIRLRSRIETGKVREWLQVEVADNGTGIAPAQLENIFEPFFSTKEPGKGTGLGLWVCFSFVAGIGGTIRAQSTEGQGTRIILRLPLVGGNDRQKAKGEG